MNKNKYNMLNVLIVDDEPLATEIIQGFADSLPSLHVVGVCNDAMDALEIIKNEPIDLIFLDIQMPQLTGVELIRSLKNPPMVIFTTAYPNYAVEGFELDAVDYLLKPISKDRFIRAVQKAEEMAELRQSENHHAANFIFVKADKKMIKLKYDDILYVEGLKDYVIIRTTEGRVITLHTMKGLEEKLPQDKFIRIHRSFIVGISKVQAVVGNMIEIMQSNQRKQLPIGKSYREKISRMVNENKL